MSYSCRPARRSEAKPLIGLYAESGCGKTYSALLLARGFAGAGKIGMIETEAGRGEAYADLIQGGYDVISLRDEFSPKAYGEALAVAEKASLRALIIDSASHEWENVGGVLDMAAINQANGKKGPIVWQRPKMEHSRHFMLPLMSTPIPLVVVCMRAHYPMRQQKRDGKDEWIKSDELKPKQADDILHEMFVHGWIDREHRLHVTKLTRPDLSTVFLDKQPITLDTGKRLSAWAKGDQQPAAASPHTPQAAGQPATSPEKPFDSGPEVAGNQSREGFTAEELRWDDHLEIAAEQGADTLREQWKRVPRGIQPKLKPRLDNIHKPAAAKAPA
jgi:hypothetical protein